MRFWEKKFPGGYPKVLVDIAGLSSGTLATISGRGRYSDLYKLRAEFADWAFQALWRNPDSFTTWQEAWEQFWSEDR